MKFCPNHLIIFCVVLLVFTSCSKDEEPVPEVLPKGNPVGPLPDDPFAATLETRLRGRVMGYAYVVMRDGNVIYNGSGGMARNERDGNLEMTTETPMHVASISKFLTTVGALKVMDKYEIPPSASVEDFLPPDWNQGPGIENLSLIELLSQKGGLNQHGSINFIATHFDSLKFIIAQGAEKEKSKFYSNTHHSLFRIILPVMQDKQNGIERVYDEMNTALSYEEIIRDELFIPTETEGSLATDLPGNAFYYRTRDDSDSGLGAGSRFTSVAGAFGWHLSAVDLATIWQTVWYSEDLISEKNRDLMEEETAGLFESYRGRYGYYYMKAGLWRYGEESAREQQTVAIHFPDDTDVVIYINSKINGRFSWISNLAISSYEESRE